ncbi:hypothetical protein DIPPA_33795 [Diplonema papillatum]|nr:hypothetical protein DIPPA_33795 [Diplonema papillatum]
MFRSSVAALSWAHPGRASSIWGRAGGGSRGGERNVYQELGSGGGVSWAAIGNVSSRPLKAYPNHYMYRMDKNYNTRTPSRGSMKSLLVADAAGEQGYLSQLKHVGVRMSNSRVTFKDHRPFTLPKRPQLVKVCDACYYWTDGIEHYNLCTQHNKAHWHRKQAEINPMEGYRSLGRQGGMRHTRKTAFTLPVHRLGADFPRSGIRAINFGNTKWSQFDKWIVMRRFHMVGARALHKKYRFVHLSFPEL